MKSTGGSDAAKRRAGEAAAETVSDGMAVGLGTGSTAAHAIRALGEAVREGLDIVGVPTSFASRQLAIEQGIPLADLDEVGSLDLAIDGADQVVLDTGDCIKGGGAAHTREKLVAAAAEELHVVVDPTKVADTLDHTVAVEVLPAARPVVERAVGGDRGGGGTRGGRGTRGTEEIGEAGKTGESGRTEENRRTEGMEGLGGLGGSPTLRGAANKDGPVVTDNGNLVLDCDFGEITDPIELSVALSQVPGVVEHGLFVGRASAVYVGTEDGVEETHY